MRDKISFAFFIIANGLIVAHVVQTAMSLNTHSQQQNAIYRVLSTETKAAVTTPVKIDYKRLAELNAETSKAEGW
ncbi:hypothetical protein [Photobacterium sp. Alg240-V54]|uniref:hypothetical protein n=1 Tax=Photobacterium sp. Alg240-V54 TaxID=2305995 RepID=UPI0013D11714|nr:hypothetical protein [Photobacterium sp. Alg240-V54]